MFHFIQTFHPFFWLSSMYMWKNIFHIILTWHRDILRIFCLVIKIFQIYLFLFTGSCSQAHIHMFASYYRCYTCCRNPSFGLVTKARACNGVGQEWSLWVTFHAPMRLRVWESLRIEPPHSQMNSHFGSWTPKFSESNCRG
jgi:hypothetical protein